MNQLRASVILFAFLGIAMLCGAGGLLLEKILLLTPDIDYLSVASFTIIGILFLLVAIVIKRHIMT